MKIYFAINKLTKNKSKTKGVTSCNAKYDLKSTRCNEISNSWFLLLQNMTTLNSHFLKIIFRLVIVDTI